MNNYTFSTLSPEEFENLARDLVCKETGFPFSRFKNGRDGGIDFRFIDNEKRHYIGQVKHYVGSNVSKLKLSLKNEVKKISELKPYQYIVVTSLGLTPDDQLSIVNLFQEHVELPVRVIGKDDLNVLINSIGKDIERSHYKLWLTSVNVMNRVLNSGIINLTDNTLQELQRKMSRYVQNSSFSEALKILNDHGVVIIVGDPGIGKTTLAQVLLSHFIDLRYEAVTVTSTIGEASAMDNESVEQVFYYDDFLGRVSLNPLLEKNEDQSILSFIEKCRRTKGKKLIMTTREYILRDAAQKYEKISTSNIGSHKYLLELGRYTTKDKAAILFNHLYFSDLLPDYVISLATSHLLPAIIRHKHYSPRIIEAMTNPGFIEDVSADDYPEFFLNNLKNPRLIYRHIVEHQLTDVEVGVLFVLVSFNSSCEIDNLELGHRCFIGGARNLKPNFTSNQYFMNALKRLEGTLISVNRKDGIEIIEFHNPSIEEFIKSRISSSGFLAYDLLVRSVYFEQIKYLLNQTNIGDLSAVPNVDLDYLIEVIYACLDNDLGDLKYVMDRDFNLIRSRIRRKRCRKIVDILHCIHKSNECVHVSTCRQMAQWLLVEISKSSSQYSFEELFDIYNESCEYNCCSREVSTDLVTAIAESIERSGLDCGNWYSALSFMSDHGYLFDECGIERIGKKLSVYAGEIIDARFEDFRDKRDWEEESDMLSYASQILNIDFSDSIERCIELLEEVKKASDYEPDYDSYSGRGYISAEHMSDEQMIDYFSPLADGFRGEA